MQTLKVYLEVYLWLGLSEWEVFIQSASVKNSCFLMCFLYCGDTAAICDHPENRAFLVFMGC